MSSYVERPLNMLAAANPVPDSMHEELAREAAVLFPSLFERVCREKQTLVPASRLRRKPLVVAAATLVLIAAIVTPALAFRAQIVDFFTASHAPKNVVVDFKRLQVEQRIMVPAGAFPAVLSSRARRITTTRVNGTRSVLYVAPIKSGGFCAMWSSNEAPRCYSRVSTPGELRFADYPSFGVGTVDGVVYARGVTVELRYADGAKTTIPYVWVTAPINAGFYIYGVPSSRRVGKARPVALIVTRGGRTLAREPIEGGSVKPGQSLAGQGLVDRVDRWGQSVQTPTEAVWSKRRLIYDFLLSDNSLVEFWVAPSRKSTDRRCFVGLFTGCEPAVLAGPPMQLQLPTGVGSGGGGEAVHEALLWGRVAARVERVKLDFQDGTQQVATPRDGFLIAKISLAHSRPGHRLLRAVGLDRSGRVIGVDRYNPATPGVYPCHKPKNYGYGITRCP